MDVVVDEGDPFERLVDARVRAIAERTGCTARGPTGCRLEDAGWLGHERQDAGRAARAVDQVQDAHEDPGADRRQRREVLETLQVPQAASGG